MQFADVKNDIAFRKIFGNENKKEILISFLNAVLKREGNLTIEQVEIVNPYQMPIVLGAKSSILDVKAKDQSGHEYIVEMQMTEKLGFTKRVQYYSAKSYSSQINTGSDYYQLKPTIFIGILNFSFLENPHYLSRHLIMDADTHEHILQDLDFNFIELPKFNKNEQELHTLVDKWVYFIKNAANLDLIPANVDDNGLRSAYQEAEQHRWSKADLEAYSYARLREADEVAREMFLAQKAEKLMQKVESGMEKVRLEWEKVESEMEKVRLEQEKVESEMEKVRLEQEKVRLEQEKVRLEQEKVRLEQEKAESEREKARLEQEKAESEWEKVRLEQEKAESEWEKVRLEQEKAESEWEKVRLDQQTMIAQKLIQRDLTNEEIADVTGLNVEQIGELRRKL